MNDLQRFMQRNLRRILAGFGLLLSLLAISVLLNTTPKSLVWMATQTIPAGSRIMAKDVELVKANLASDSHHFEGSTDTVIGQFAGRLMQPGDLVAVTDVEQGSPHASAIYLPIGVAVDDLPADLALGDLVDIYVIPKDQGVLPAIVAHRVAIQNIDVKSRALGGNVAVSVEATSAVTAIIVTAESQGRLVLARDPL